MTSAWNQVTFYTMTSAAKFLLLTAVFGLLAACRKEPQTNQGHSISGSTMGTYFRVTLSEFPNGIPEDTLQTTLQARLDRIDARMSTYKPDSEYRAEGMGTSNDTELTSMGMQAFFNDTQWQMMVRQDRQHLALIIAALRGY